MKNYIENIKKIFDFRGRLNLKDFFSAYFYGLLILYVSIHLILQTFLFIITYIPFPYEIWSFINQCAISISLLSRPIGFLIFSYFLIVISRKRSRDMNADVLLSFVFFVPLSIFSFIILLYLGFFQLDFGGVSPPGF